MNDSAGPAALRWARELRSLTQQELAERSGLSERTVRGLERGQVAVPHPSTLESLADAAGLTDDDRRMFIRAWEPARVRSWEDLTKGYVPVDDLVAELAVQHNFDQGVVGSWLELRVWRDTQILRTRTVIEAQHDGLASVPIAYVYHQTEHEPEITFRAFGATSSTRCHIPETGHIVFEVQLPTVLRHGETAAIDVELEMHGVPAKDYPEPTDWHLYAQQRAVPMVVLRTTFEEVRPEIVWEIEMLSDGGRRRVCPVTPDADGAVLQINRYRPPGLYGFEWPYPLDGGRTPRDTTDSGHHGSMARMRSTDPEPAR